MQITANKDVNDAIGIIWEIRSTLENDGAACILGDAALYLAGVRHDAISAYYVRHGIQPEVA